MELRNALKELFIRAVAKILRKQVVIVRPDMIWAKQITGRTLHYIILDEVADE